ncbi:MAG: segregation/condensation protein A [Proteobacteria bacterium]|nr:segregation/condensation protein A [Pseudomonadota bacterium]
MQDEVYQVKLDNIFEGPMDLLVHLIKKNEVDIYDIPIALITDQYLVYLEWMKSMNIDIAGDFIVMAATLTQIKSKMLLPAHAGDDDQEDPRLEIARPLAEYLQIKSAAEHLAERSLLGEDTFVRIPGQQEFSADLGDEIIKVGLFELIDAFQKILVKLSPDERVLITAESVSVKDRISELVDVFESKESLTFDELFPKNAVKSEIIVTFLAILEMVRLNLIRIAQHIQTGVIRLFYL